MNYVRPKIVWLGIFGNIIYVYLGISALSVFEFIYWLLFKYIMERVRSNKKFIGLAVFGTIIGISVGASIAALLQKYYI